MTRPGGRWRNWGRTVQVRPQRVERPRTPEAVQRAVQAAAARSLRVKAVGAGHSFSGIAAAPGVLLDLDDLSGLVRVDVTTGRATLLAGTRLRAIPRLLAPYGLAMANLGDIDRQSIAGAVSTGTHGTGARFGGLATQVVGATIVTASGELLTVGADDTELLPAVSVGLGALGVLVEVTLQCVPTFVLHAVERTEPLDDVIASLEHRTASADHFGFHWFPHTDIALTKTNTRLAGDATLDPPGQVGRWFDASLLSGVRRAACAAGAVVPALVPPVNRLVTRVGDREYRDLSHRVFTQHRGVRFREMEYALPVARTAAAFSAVRDQIRRSSRRISFPVEVRFAAADDRWLSTAYGRDTGYIAVRRYWREDEREYFDAVEEIMLAHDGRPHWGGLHSLSAEELADRHPRFADFVALRDRLDTGRMFQNRHLERVLGA